MAELPSFFQHPPPPEKKRGPLWIGLGLGAAVLLGVGAFFLSREPKTPSGVGPSRAFKLDTASGERRTGFEQILDILKKHSGNPTASGFAAEFRANPRLDKHWEDFKTHGDSQRFANETVRDPDFSALFDKYKNHPDFQRIVEALMAEPEFAFLVRNMAPAAPAAPAAGSSLVYVRKSEELSVTQASMVSLPAASAPPPSAPNNQYTGGLQTVRAARGRAVAAGGTSSVCPNGDCSGGGSSAPGQRFRATPTQVGTGDTRTESRELSRVETAATAREAAGGAGAGATPTPSGSAKGGTSSGDGGGGGGGPVASGGGDTSSGGTGGSTGGSTGGGKGFGESCGGSYKNGIWVRCK